MLSQPEPIPVDRPKVAISTLPTGLCGGFLWGPVDWPGQEGQYATAFALQTPPSDPGNVLICFPSSGATVEVAKSDLVIPSPILALPRP